MATNIDALAVRKALGRENWQAPQQFGPDGWSLLAVEDDSSVILSCADYGASGEWVHASIAHPHRDPTYTELARLHRAVWRGRGFAYQIFAADNRHVNIHSHALHLWGRLDGRNVLPDFGAHGTI